MWKFELKGDRVPIRLWTSAGEVEEEALRQLKNTAKLPWVFRAVVAMPDVHTGIGATIGTVVAMKSALAPAAVGVDIGCGMSAVRTSLLACDLPDSLRNLRAAIETSVPVGFNEHRHPLDWPFADNLWKGFPRLDSAVQGLSEKAHRQLGTLGGGNHFIELCLDEEQQVWIMLHSGSRHIGKELAERHIARARRMAHNLDLPDRDLAVFLSGTPEMDAYRHDLAWAQAYARENREAMLELVENVLRHFRPCVRFDPAISCHHNYAAEEIHFGEKVFVTRKGAIRAAKGEMGIIPGSMGTKSYIVRGLGNPESFLSASHGAGRRMSRREAMRRFETLDLECQTEGVECRKDRGILDEIPGAYKDIDSVMAYQTDLVEPVHTLKQVLCVKG